MTIVDDEIDDADDSFNRGSHSVVDDVLRPTFISFVSHHIEVAIAIELPSVSLRIVT